MLRLRPGSEHGEVVAVMPGRGGLRRTAALETVEAALTGPPGDWFGVELERLVVEPGRPAVRPGPDRLAPACDPPMPAGSRVTLEPGGQLELSTSAAATVTGALDRLARDTAELGARLAALGLRTREAAIDLERAPARVLEAPRYAAMERFFAADGEAGSWMMANTASVQVNVSHAAGRPAARWRLAQAVGPVLLAAFANSPGHDSSGRRWESLRQAVWWSVDPGRTRPPRPRHDLVHTWLAYALAADVMLVREPDGAMVGMAPGTPFARWCREGADLGSGRRFPGAEDLRYHLTTLFPPVRARGWLELRMIDALPLGLCEVATLVAGTVLTTDAGDELLARLPDTSTLWRAAARHGLAHPVLAAAARCLFATALERLPAVSGERAHHDAVAAYAETHVARAQAPAQTVPDAALAGSLRPRLGRRAVECAGL